MNREYVAVSTKNLFDLMGYLTYTYPTYEVSQMLKLEIPAEPEVDSKEAFLRANRGEFPRFLAVDKEIFKSVAELITDGGPHGIDGARDAVVALLYTSPSAKINPADLPKLEALEKSAYYNGTYP